VAYLDYEIAKHAFHIAESNGAPLPYRRCPECGYRANRNQSVCPNCYWVIEGIGCIFPTKEEWEKWDKTSDERTELSLKGKTNEKDK